LPLGLLCSLASTLLFAGASPGAVTLAVAPAVALALALSATLAKARSLAILSGAAIGANAAVLLEAFRLAGSALLFGLRRAAIAASIATTPGTLPLVLSEGRPCCEQPRSDYQYHQFAIHCLSLCSYCFLAAHALRLVSTE